MQAVSPEFQNAFLADAMHLDHKVIIELGNNRFNDGQVVTATSTKAVSHGIEGSAKSETREFWRGSDVFNNKNRNTMKWLVCDRGAVAQAEEDGTGYRAINVDDGEYERGWWSGTKSNGAGEFGIAQQVQSEFFQSDGTTPFDRRANKIALYLTEGYRTMKEVSVFYKNTSGTWISVASNYSVADGTYHIEWTIADTLIRGLRLQVHKTWDADDYARANELQAYFHADVSEDIIDIDISEVRQEYEGTVPIGSTAANELSLTLDNTTGRYNIKNTESDLYPYLSPNNKITVEFGIDINQGVGSPSYEYTPMGEFWVDEWEDDGGSATATVNARDFSKFLQDEVAQFSRVWQNTNVKACLTDIMARAGKMPGEETDIDTAALRSFDILFIKDQTLWEFMQEVALADQGVFGFNRDGQFYYHSYNRLNTAPYTGSSYDLRYDREIVEGSVATELYVNKVIVKVSPVSTENTGLRQIWEAPGSSILSWAKLGASITSSSTTITVSQADNQSTSDLGINNWPDRGYLWLPSFDTDGSLIYGEIIKYNGRSTTQFTNCERGYLGTPKMAHTSGAYIGEVEVWDVEFDNAPALDIRFPVVAMIDVLPLLDGEGTEPQAYVPIWEPNPFGGKLAVGNIVDWYTILQGSGISFVNETDGDNTDDVIYDWYTLIQGVVSVKDEGRQETGRNNKEFDQINADYIRRYGKNELTIDNLWIQSKSHAEDLAEFIIDEYRKPREILRLETIMPPNLELADRVNIFNYPQLDIANRQYHIISINWTYDGGLQASVTLREVKS